MKRSLWVFFSLSIILTLLVSCTTRLPEATGDAPAATVSSTSDERIVIEGRLVPALTLALSFSANGRVSEVLVQEGDSVEEGQLIARLDGREQADAAVIAAELELLLAQQAVNTLNNNQDAVKNQALIALTSARQAVVDAQDRLDAIMGDNLTQKIEAAKAQVLLTQDRLETAQDNYEVYADEAEDNLDRATYRIRLAEAQQAYDEAIRSLDHLQGEGYDFTLRQAQDALTAAETQVQIAESEYEKASAGPDPDAMNSANARVQAAQASLVAVRKNAGFLELQAQFSGTVVEVNMQPGQTIAAGAPVVVVADLTSWYVETTDLTEIDVVNIKVGQPVAVNFDALPDTTLDGEVVSIRDSYRESRGDVTYLTRVRLIQDDLRLRWGMTALVSFSAHTP